MRIQDLYSHVCYQRDSDYPHFTNLIDKLSEQPFFPSLLDSNLPSCRVNYATEGGWSRVSVESINAQTIRKFSSQKNNRLIDCETQSAFEGFSILERCSSVVSYVEQPATIHFEMDGRSHTHFPHALVALRNGRMVFVEFQTPGKKEDPNLADRSRFLTDQLPRLGYRYLVIIPVNWNFSKIDGCVPSIEEK